MSFTYCVSVLYWEKHTVPDEVVEKVEKGFLAYGLQFKAKEVRTLFPFGLEVKDFSLTPVKKYTFPEVYGKYLQMDLVLWELFKGISFPVRVHLENGSAKLPLFPELEGDEGAEDCIELIKFTLDIQGKRGGIFVKHFQGESKGAKFTVSGSVNNVLHSIAAAFGHSLTEKLWEKDLHKKRADFSYSSQLQGIPEELRMALAAFSRILQQSPGHREKQHLLPVDWYLTGKKKIFLKGTFHADLFDFTSCKATAVLDIPESIAGNCLKLDKAKLHISLADGVLRIRKNTIETGNGQYVCWEGTYDGKTGVFSGKADGKIAIYQLLPFIPAEERDILSNFPEISKNRIAFSCQLKEYYVKSRVYNILVDLVLPPVVYRGIRLTSSPCRMRLTPDGVRGEIGKIFFSCPEQKKEKGMMTLSFLHSGNILQGDFSGNIPFAFLEKEFTAFPLEIKSREKEEKISFNGRIRFQNELSGKLHIDFPSFTALGNLQIRDLTAGLRFSSGRLFIEQVKGSLADSLEISLSGELEHSQKKLFLSLHGKGSPEEAVKQLAPRYREKLEDAFREIRWPEKGALADLAAKVCVDYEKTPLFWFADGNIVIADFQYRKIPFRYFATKFLLDSRGNLALPGAVLETDQGRAVLNGIYEEKTRKDKKKNDLVSGNGKLVFDLTSTMNGNDVLRCLYPQWKSDFLDFPYPVKVDASGCIDYGDDTETVFTAHIGNGRCFWKKAALTNVDCTVQYAGELLTIPNATAMTCGGNLMVNYSFDFNEKREKGKIRLELKNADFPSVMKGMGAEFKQLEGIEANCSGELTADVSFDEKDRLLLTGKGTADISGEDLWHIPVFGELLKILGNAWHTQALGTITKFNMAFSLDKTTFRVDQGSSDGSVVAISTDGSYDWSTEEFDFYIRSELLKGTLPFAAMSKVLTPVSWILQKRIRGKGDNVIWE
ncbi:MAG: hypothetical protein IKA79_05355 [Lentisphaeria bacterium]|nr:hypothetical protein [Lentisphaeria bacterium]